MGESADPCNYSQGEVEDYGVILIGKGLEEEEEQIAVPSLYPNPAGATLHLENLESFYAYRIYDRAGALLKEQSFKTDAIDLNIEQLAPGIYLLELEREGGAPWVQNFIKE